MGGGGHRLAAVAPSPRSSPSREGTASSQFRKIELSEVVREALEVLSEDQKMAVLLNKFEDMSYAEIGGVMSRSPTAIKSLLARARNELRERLEPYLATGQRARGTPADGRAPCRPAAPDVRQMTRSPGPGVLRQILARGLAACGHAVDDLVFPWTCLLCGSEGPGCAGRSAPPAGPSCWRRPPPADEPACPRCALPVGPFADLRGGCAKCRGHSLGFDAALALGPYEGPVRDLCLRLKHERNAWLAPWLCDLLAEARQADLARLPGDAWVVPVPLHWWRRLRRGYNQAEALAERPGPAARPPRPPPAPAGQVHATLWPRRARPSGWRPCAGPSDARRDPGLKGRTILLVDDILTTGATSGAAARALKQAGARRVVVAVLARTV